MKNCLHYIVLIIPRGRRGGRGQLQLRPYVLGNRQRNSIPPQNIQQPDGNIYQGQRRNMDQVPEIIDQPNQHHQQGRIQDFKIGGALKKIAPSGGRRENVWGISCKKSRFYAKKIIFFPILGGGAGCTFPWIRPWSAYCSSRTDQCFASPSCRCTTF